MADSATDRARRLVGALHGLRLSRIVADLDDVALLMVAAFAERELRKRFGKWREYPEGVRGEAATWTDAQVEGCAELLGTIANSWTGDDHPLHELHRVIEAERASRGL